MIAISSITFDLEGTIVFQNNSVKGLDERKRRVSRIKTLDGKAILNDTGFSNSDLTIDIEIVTASKEDINKMKQIIEYNATILVATKDGTYIGVAELIEQQDDYILRVLPTEKTSG